MSIDLNDEILQDFLVEAGEIIDLLDGQLVDLETNPDDKELLNAIFRGFHTVKGGAGFLGIDALVVLCHRSEDVFNLLRQGDLKVSQKLMDVVLKVHDTLRTMFTSINDGVEPDTAEPELIRDLESFLELSDENEAAEAPVKDAVSTPDIIDGSDADQNPQPDSGVEQSDDEAFAGSEDITDDEFEMLLDKLHGTAAPAAMTTEQGSGNKGQTAHVDSENISDDEFENLLDTLHGSAIPGASVTDSLSDDETAMAEEAVESTEIVSETETESPEDKAEPVVTESARTTAAPARESDKPAKHQEATVRVDTGRLDDIMNLVGELVLVRNRLATLESTVANEDMSVAVSNLDLVTSDLQTAVMKTRMQPIKKVFGRFPRVVRDLSRSLGKDVELVMIGEDTDLDKNLVEALADPLIHLVRNSVDHGIEMPDVRADNGKVRKGTITLSARQEGENILLSIEDDGAGIDPEVIKRIAIDKGVIDADTAARLTDEESYNLIFMPGFSTKEAISDISGRGVGMDVVKTKITQLNGTIRISSEIGTGSVIEIKVPLTLAIMPTLMVKIASQVYALPLTSVVEIFNFDESAKKTVDGQEVLLIRDKALPIYHLDKWLSNSDDGGENKRVVVVNSAGKEFGFVVDSLLGQEEVVIKPLGALLHGTQGMSGATITGDGKISLILDVPGLMQTYASGL
jgi:two-component system chemotaxis sensor kinase CheA